MELPDDLPACVEVELPAEPEAVHVVELGDMGPRGEPGRDGTGVFAARAPASVDLAAGQPLALARVGIALVPADASEFASAHVVGLAAADTAAGMPAAAVRDGVALSDWTAAVGAPDLIPGRDYFLAAGGGLSPMPDTAPGHCTVRVGWAADARTLVVEPCPPFLN